MNESTRDMKMDKMYPLHFGAMRKAGLWKQNDKVPTLREATELVMKKEDTKYMKLKRKRERDRKRKIFFVIGYSKFWPKSIPKMIDELLEKFPSLKWLRYSMSYRRFPNISQLIHGDLIRKVNENVISSDEERNICNCRKKKGEPQACKFNGVCSESNVVYEIECKTTGN
jgi:hypothetical protein